MKKGFSLIELLVVIAIIAIILSFGIPWIGNYVNKKKIEKDTHTIYLTLKQYQLEAKLKKQSFCITLADNYTLVIKNDTCSGSVIKEIHLEKPFDKNNDLIVNKFGIFIQPGSIHYVEKVTDILSCVRVDDIRICEGYWDGSECVCKY